MKITRHTPSRGTALLLSFFPARQLWVRWSNERAQLRRENPTYGTWRGSYSAKETLMHEVKPFASPLP